MYIKTIDHFAGMAKVWMAIGNAIAGALFVGVGYWRAMSSALRPEG